MVTLVIGIGNEFRSDDAAGVVVARALAAIASSSLQVTEASGEGAALIELWQGFESVILVDAVQSGAEAGTVHEWDVSVEPLPAEMTMHSSHAFGIVEAIELARALGKLPRKLIVYGIEGQCFENGTDLTQEVKLAVRTVVKRIMLLTAPEGEGG